jgi:hypothetical protein
MKKIETLLTNLPLVLELSAAEFSYKEIAEKLNHDFNISLKDSDIWNCIYNVKNDKLNKKYNTFALLPLSIDADELIKYSIIEHGLIITTPAVARYYEMTHEVLDAHNFRKK